MTPRRNILIFHLGALGDFILTWPLAMALSRLHPQSRIIYVTHHQKGLLAEKLLRIESADIEQGWHHLYSDGRRLPDASASLLRNSHGVYTCIASPGDVWTDQVRAIAPESDLVHINPHPPDGFTAHATEYIMSQLSSRTVIAQGMRQMIGWLSQHALKPGRPQKPAAPIILHPGSGSSEKCWPACRFLDLADRLRAQHAVRVLLGETELERWPSSQIEAFRAVAELRQPTTYLDLLDGLSDGAFYVGNDSGPTHLAAILGLPTFCIFGPSDPAVWRPLGPRIHILRRVPIDQITVHEVHEWVSCSCDALRAAL